MAKYYHNKGKINHVSVIKEVEQPVIQIPKSEQNPEFYFLIFEIQSHFLMCFLHQKYFLNL